MKLYFFCARDVRDYLQNFPEAKTLNFPPDEFNPSAFMRIARIQNFLYTDIMSSVACRDEALNAPICGETGIDGLRLDFNFGLRLDVPEGNFRVRIGEIGGRIFFDEKVSDMRLISVEKYFIRWHVEVFSDDVKIFEHVFFDLTGQPVLVAAQTQALGDTLALLPAVDELRRRFDCKVSLHLPEFLREFAAHLYPEINVVDATDYEHYATFYPNLIRGNSPINPTDARDGNLAKVLGEILGIDWFASKATFTPTAPPVTSEPYVCIAVQASANRKCWLWPNGWDIVVDYLKTLGYRVFCIDKNSSATNDGVTIEMPAGAEDFTGNFPIMERANMLYHAEFFIGLGSGLSWVADAVNCPVVMICGFSKDWCEFYSPYRVINRLICNGCLNDVRDEDFLTGVCPRHKGTPRAFECQRKISPQQVLNAVERLIVDRNLTPPALKKF